MRNRHVPGQHLVTDDQSGRVYYNSEMVQLWDGRVVEKAKKETRHPHEYVPSIPAPVVPWPIRYDSYGTVLPNTHTSYESTSDTGDHLMRTITWCAGMHTSVSPTEGLVFTRINTQSVISTLQARTMGVGTFFQHYQSPKLGRQFIKFDDEDIANTIFTFTITRD